MKNKVMTSVGIGTAALVLALASTSFAQNTNTPLAAVALAERLAAARQRIEESTRYLNELMAKAQAETEARRALLPARPPVDPEVAKAALEKQRYARKLKLAPWLFGPDSLPTEQGIAFLENQVGRERALAASGSARIRPKISPERLIRSPTGKLSQATPTEIQTDGGADPLYLMDWLFDPQQNRTLFRLWLVNGPLDEWWEIYHAAVLQSTAWQLAFVGPPDDLSGNVQQFFVAVEGQPDQAFFQIFLKKDSDYDGIPDGYEVAILKTDPLNPDSDSTRDADGNGQPDFPALGANGIADGDEDFDGDRLSTSYELSLGVDPLVPQATTDSDGDKLLDWVEELITYWQGDPNPGPQDDTRMAIG